MARLTKKTSIIAAGSAAVALSISGAAYAYWTTTGSGTASATTGSNVALTVTQDGTVTGLVPGGTAAAVNYTITNGASTNQYATTVTINKVSVNYINPAGAGNGTTALNHPAGFAAVTCTVADFDVVQPDPLNTDLTPGTHAYTRSGTPKSGTVALLNTGSNQDDCKNTTINLAFALV